ncbi:dual specificity protein kinase yak1 [Entophlyctis luteolus]|nr:dual specificity protein kinase yak1 [Entophlyctis luteolus]
MSTHHHQQAPPSQPLRASPHLRHLHPDCAALFADAPTVAIPAFACEKCFGLDAEGEREAVLGRPSPTDFLRRFKDAASALQDTVSSHSRPASVLSLLTSDLAGTYAMCDPSFKYNAATANPKRVLTKPAKPVSNDGADNQDADFILYVNDILGSQDGQQFQILDLLGQGTFGQVAKCVNIKTKEQVAVKVIKNKAAYYNQSLVEVAILDLLNNRWDVTDKHHIVQMKDTFVFRNHLCIVFEMLSSNLYELIKQNQFRGIGLNLVRLFVQQILDCLILLSNAKIIHSDLKPENILLKSPDLPSIKVIDFGSACHENQTIYTYIQSRFYRAPEVLLGLPYTSSIDMWSLGCIAAELYLGLPLFPGTSEYNQVSRIVGVLGTPPQWINVTWRLKKISNRKSLLDFLKVILKINPLERWSPQQAKLHPFVTGEKLTTSFANRPGFGLGPQTVPASDPQQAAALVSESVQRTVPNVDCKFDPELPISQNNVLSVQEPSTLVLPKRPRANTMIQAVPPQLQKIVTIQQQSGPNKVTLRNAAGAPPLPNGPSAGSGNGVVFAPSNLNLNNDDVVYSPDLRPKDEEVVFGQVNESQKSGRNSVQQFTLRKAASESLNSQHRAQHIGSSTFVPLPSSHQAAESVGVLGAGPKHQMALYSGSTIPFELLQNMNPTSIFADTGPHQHPRVGERGERAKAGPSRAPSFPGLYESQQSKTDGDFSHSAPRNFSHSELSALSLTQEQFYRRMSLSDGHGLNANNASPRYRQYLPSLPSSQLYNQGGYSVAGAQQHYQYPPSPRNSHMPGSPLSQHPPTASDTTERNVSHQMSGLGLYEDSSFNGGFPTRGRSMSVSVNTQYPLNHPWNQPILPTNEVSKASQLMGTVGGNSGGSIAFSPGSSQHASGGVRTSKKQLLSISISQGSPQHQHPQGYPYSAGYQPGSAHANDLTGIPPQRLSHPANLGIRRTSVQYGSTPPTFGGSSYNSTGGAQGMRGSGFGSGSIGSAGLDGSTAWRSARAFTLGPVAAPLLEADMSEGVVIESNLPVKGEDEHQ